jgi:cytosine/uracil/thiamine/allantoin permease
MLSFKAGSIITAVLGLLTMPWKLYDSFLNFLVAYSVLLGPVVGVVMTDYYVIRGRKLDVDALFSSSPQGSYWYQVRQAFQLGGTGPRVSSLRFQHRVSGCWDLRT